MSINYPPIAYTPRTRRQAEVFPIILDFFRQFNRIPSSRELAKLLNLGNHNSPARMIRNMIGGGLLVKRTTPDGRQVIVPVGVRVNNKRSVS